MARFVNPDIIIDGSLFLTKLDSSSYFHVLSTSGEGQTILKDLELNLLKDVSLVNIVDQSNITYDEALGLWKDSPPPDIEAIVSGILSNTQYSTILPPGYPDTTINHNLGTQFPRVLIVDSSSRDLINTGINYIDTSSLSVGIELPLDNSIYVLVNGEPQNVASENLIGGGTEWTVGGTNIDGGDSW